MCFIPWDGPLNQRTAARRPSNLFMRRPLLSGILSITEPHGNFDATRKPLIKLGYYKKNSFFLRAESKNFDHQY